VSIEGRYVLPVPGATPLMTDPTPTARPQPDPTASSAAPGPGTGPGRAVGPVPDPIGDVVPGDPPVPITVWHLPRPRPGTLVSVGLARRLIANYTRPGGRVVDLSTGARLDQSGRDPAALVVTGWPAGRATPTEHLAACAAGLDEGGCVAVVLAVTQTPDLLGTLVTAARATGLTYLQHVVVAH
jgi:hypothetical protein